MPFPAQEKKGPLGGSRTREIGHISYEVKPLYRQPGALAAIGHPIRRCHPYARKSASQAVLSRMQLTLHATRRTPHVLLRA